MTTFAKRVEGLPRLGVGLSGEFNVAARGMDVHWLKEHYPALVHFYEYGADLDRGLDDGVRRWAAAGRPTTYHFLDINLEERIDIDRHWVARTRALAAEIGAAWFCGDAGRWHFGSRERGHGMLMPPILCRESALETAESIMRIEAETGMFCLPENPPSVIYLGDLHILDYFALVAERADCGLLLDCAHLAIFQQTRDLPPLAGLDNFPLDRVVEMHVAGGTYADVEGYAYIEDSHSPEPLAATWEILQYVLPRATNLRAIVFECERNAPEECLDGFARLNELFPVGKEKAIAR
ncbi:MAG: multinuclear nonheme iron-dependent oxidase [Pseudomonadota bacterium]